MSTETKTLDQASPDELRAQLKRVEAKERAEQKRKRTEYESNRNHTVVVLLQEAMELHKGLKLFKSLVEDKMDEQALKLNEYGLMRGNSKGGFSITNEADTFRIRRTRETNPTWDERSTKGVSLIKEFLHDAVKKRAEKEFNLLMSFLEKNKQGDLEYQKVMILLSHEDAYGDPRWKEGLRLVKESYKVVQKGFGYQFEIKNPEGKWETMSLNFSNL
ncbi:DUF3164 family protein [Corallibacter sp.]|uniref:DUF3164 family protein n=1 Tax=Corallibacter sp. TaxID=2038084 RepID=UPI003A916CCF